MDVGQTNCDLNDESGDVVSDLHVIVNDDKSQLDSQRHPATKRTTLLNLCPLIRLM